ncbi:MAG: arginine N-succinyltransferase [Candidatus Protochlamydia sp.]|nr:arginine N-succinyltransferase [Candidatus Protochlamydia sp.]
MIIIRPIAKKDLGIFAEFSFESMLGITSLSRDRGKLEEKIILSENSFIKEVKWPASEEYYFVLEDLTTSRIGGICGILAQNRTEQSSFYKIENISTNASHISAPKEMKVLRVVTRSEKSSEICSLYLQPTFRHSGQGRLLSLSRFLFIAAHKNRFEKKILAELRGVIDQRQISPFWEEIGRHFCRLSFVELMAQIDQDRTFIKEILPKFPLYIDLLPKNVQGVIGKTHESTKPALHMLVNEGFVFKGEIDSFDGGPLLTAPTNSIRTVKNSALVQIRKTDELLTEENEYLLSNDHLEQFRACFGRLKFISKNEAFIHDKVAESLLINNGEKVRYVSIHSLN